MHLTLQAAVRGLVRNVALTVCETRFGADLDLFSVYSTTFNHHLCLLASG